MGLGAEVWERELQDVQGTEEVGCELVTKVVLVLVFAGAYNACVYAGFSLPVWR